MIDDDDLFVVIVDDANSDYIHEAGNKCKSELKGSYVDYENDFKVERNYQKRHEIEVDVENILYIAQEHGEILHYDEVSERIIRDVSNLKSDEEYNIILKEEDYEPHFICVDAQNCTDLDTDNETHSGGDNDENTTNYTHWRNKRVMVSYVQKLREKFPHLRNNKENLIKSIALKMKNTIAPEPPYDYITYDVGEYRCKYCNTASSSEYIAQRHYQQKHGERYLVCFACGATFRWTTNLYKHERGNCQSRDILIVLKARALCEGQNRRSRAYIPDFSNKPRKRYSCTECSATFANMISLEPHLRMHRGERPFLCPKCPLAYTSQIGMANHMKKHSNKNFICDYCGKVLKEKAKLVAHLVSHAPMKKFGCQECPIRYSTKADLMVHVNRDHRNLPAPFDCKICPMRFSRMQNLKSHMRNIHEMVIITSKMFVRSLPEMSEKELETTLQRAIVVRKNPNTSSSNIQEGDYEL